ncbi:CLUMA_CG018117, isoform A [Clunio marinus]|uniref:CLUMA_CG018117, isoform A n=1 Tax=Clunio marinus TaxID=568069 RepID=A0A1J1IZ13_9DIPT|nr:CLUMA_CG018117, isoform A [Clunio marinus]
MAWICPSMLNVSSGEVKNSLETGRYVEGLFPLFLDFLILNILNLAQLI